MLRSCTREPFYAADVNSVQSSEEAIGDESAFEWKVEQL